MRSRPESQVGHGLGDKSRCLGRLSFNAISAPANGPRLAQGVSSPYVIVKRLEEERASSDEVRLMEQAIAPGAKDELPLHVVRPSIPNLMQFDD
jgi:hypothetical protein